MFLWQKLKWCLPRDPENGGGGGAGGGSGGAGGGSTVAPGGSAILDPGGAGGGGTPQGGGQPQGGGEPGAWKVPDGVPDQFKTAKDANEFANLVLTDWQRQRGEISKFQPPKDASEYKFEPSEKVKPFVGNLDKDPVFGFAKEAALKAGVPAQAFQGLVGGLYEAMAEKGMLPKPYDAGAERRAYLGDEARNLSDEQIIEKMTPAVNGAVDFLRSLQTTNVIDADGLKELGALLDSGTGLRTVLALQKAMKTPGLTPGGGDPGSAGLTRADLQKRQADPRNDPASPQFERAYAEETSRLYKKMFG